MLSVAIAAATLSLSPLAGAALFDRGGGLIYDDVLNVTWAQDIGLAFELGYNPVDGTFGNAPSIEEDLTTDSFLTHDQAKAFATALNGLNSGAGYAGVNTWQLPTLSLADLSDTTLSNDGSTNKGYNITRTTDPLAHMHYVTLGALGNLDTSGVETFCKTGTFQTCMLNTANSNIDFFNNTAILNGGGSTTTTLFYNEDVLDAPGGSPISNRAWGFVTREGFQGNRVDNSGSNGGGGYAWVYAVGDTAPPAPPAPTPTLSERAFGAAVYDSTLDLTWASNVDLANELGYDPIARTFGNTAANTDGFLTHTQALNFAADLSTTVFNGTIGYLGVTNWQLPSLAVADLSDTASTNSGSANKGYNIRRVDSPLSHLMYVALGAEGNRAFNGASSDCQENGFTSSCLLNTTNDNGQLSLFNFSVLSTTSDTLSTIFYQEKVLDEFGTPVPNEAWGFVTRLGFQGNRVEDTTTHGGGGYALVVAPGDMSEFVGENVPVLPFWGFGLLGSALLGLAAFTKSKTKTKNIT